MDEDFPVTYGPFLLKLFMDKDLSVTFGPRGINNIEMIFKPFTSVNTLITEEEKQLLHYLPEFLNRLEMNGPHPELTLKEGTIVTSLQSLNAAKGLLNGMRPIVRRIQDNIIDLKV